MRNIVLSRIDERLIHGQVMTSWIKIANPNKVLVIDNASATNAFLKRILFAAAPKDMELLVMTTEDATAYLKEDADAGERIFILTKVPKPFLEAIRNGVKIDEIILGNMGGAAGRKRFNKNVNASDEEIQDFKDIIALGTNLYSQMVPSDSKEDVRKLL